MPPQKRQSKAKSAASTTASGSVKTKSKSKGKSKGKTGDKIEVTSYTDLTSNNGDFGDYFWNQAGSGDQDDASMAVNYDGEHDRTAENNLPGSGGQ